MSESKMREADIAITVTGKDRPDLLAKSLATLNQQIVRPREFILTDCSDDPDTTRQVVDSFRVTSDISRIEYHWFPKEELPRAIGRQRAAELATTSLIVSTETDILFPRDVCARMIAMFGDPPKKIFGSVGLIKLDKRGGVRTKRVKQKSGAFQVFRKSDFEAVGGYNPFLTMGWGSEDTDFRERMLVHGCKMSFCDLFVIHQWHPEVSNKKSNLANKRIAATSKWTGTKWARTT